jgi:hypothetical protein
VKIMEEKCTKFVSIRVADVQMCVCAVDKTFFVMQLVLPRCFIQIFLQNAAVLLIRFETFVLIFLHKNFQQCS